MAPSTIERWRAHLLIAALAGIFIQGFMLVSLLAWHVPEAFFTTMTFRICRHRVSHRDPFGPQLADVAFRAALACGYVRVTGIDRRTVVVSSDCAYRRLVVLHIRLHGNRYGGVHG